MQILFNGRTPAPLPRIASVRVLGAAIEVTAELGCDAVFCTYVNDLIETGFVDLSAATTSRTQEHKMQI